MPILRFITEFRTDPLSATAGFLGLVLALIFGIAFHEFAHAFTAYRLGDYTPVRQGRITLNPAAHLDRLGMLFFAISGFGWGRPVEFNPYAIRMNPRIGSGLIAFAGPLANITLGVVIGLVVRLSLLFLPFGEMSGPVLFIILTLVNFVLFNFVLAIFNLIPIPPLDGSKILPALLPPDMAYSLERVYGQLGPYALMLLFLIFWLPGIGTFFSEALNAPVFALLNLVVGPFF